MRLKSILLAGNWKMNHVRNETTHFLNSINIKNKKTNAKCRLYVPTLSLTTALDQCHQNQLAIEIGAQNVHGSKSGAFTGETSALMLKDVGIDQVLVGHSERRQYFGETNESVLSRVVGALEQDLEVLLCIGETLGERNQNQTQSVIKNQLELIFNHEVCLNAFSKKLHIAYEPVWAIGTGVTATPTQAEEAHAFIRSQLEIKLGIEKASATRILYGGSVTPQNFKELLACPNIDGGLVGGASLKPESFQALWDLI